MTDPASIPAGLASRMRRRWRLWLCAVVLGLVTGFVGVPESGLRYAKSVLRRHDVAAQEVVVAIDDKTLARIGEWPFPRSTFAKLTDALFAQGARRVFFVLNFSTSQSAQEDAALAQAIARHPGRVYLGTTITGNTKRWTPKLVLPKAEFAQSAQLANISTFVDRFGSVSRLPYAMSVHGALYDGLAAQLAGRRRLVDSDFPIDTSIARRSVPVLSMADALNGRSPTIRGKDVLVGATSDTLNDLAFVAPYGLISSTEIFALGAETLRSGSPLDLGWTPALLFAALSGAFALLLANRTHGLAVVAVSAAILLVGPLLLPTTIFVSVVPGLATLCLLIAAHAQRHVRAMLRSRATINQVSGLLNLTALRELPTRPNDRLVVARLHNFAEVIATLPPEAEAALVAQVAARLKLGMIGGELYHGDNGVFAWFAGDDVGSVGERLDGLHALFRSPVTASGQPIDLSVTFGVDDGPDRSVANRLGSALVAADEAAAEGTKWRAFDTAKLADAAWKLSLLSQLDAAIDEGDLWVAYQPKLDLVTRHVIGAEALVRWTHPEKGAISPIEFVAAAEQHNRIEKLTQHVLDRAVLAAATINAHDISFGIAVNLSARLLQSRDVVEMVTAALAEHKLAPERLTLEITETAALAGGGSLDVLNELRALGLHISIDDYGTGLSTLEYLRKIPASEIKIDRTFIQAMLASGSDLLMVNSTIQLAHSLGHRVVAEGVETDEALARLAELGCDIAQGYRIGRPMTFQDLARRLLADRQHAA